LRVKGQGLGLRVKGKVMGKGLGVRVRSRVKVGVQGDEGAKASNGDGIGSEKQPCLLPKTRAKTR
jgi:hypothetical protein